MTYSQDLMAQAVANLNSLPQPVETHSYKPLPFGNYVDMLHTAIAVKFEIVGFGYELARKGQRLFGHFDLASPANGLNRSIGFRTGYDKLVSTGIVGGSEVQVCSNMDFSGEVKYMRRHTVNSLADIEPIILTAIDELESDWQTAENWYELIRNTELLPERADTLILNAVEQKVIGSQKALDVRKQFINPSYDHDKHTVGTLHNAFTQIFKGYNDFNLIERSTRLKKLLNAEIAEFEVH